RPRGHAGHGLGVRPAHDGRLARPGAHGGRVPAALCGGRTPADAFDPDPVEPVDRRGNARVTEPVHIIGTYLSPYVRKVLVVLHLKGLAYDIHPTVPFMGADRLSHLITLRLDPCVRAGW